MYHRDPEYYSAVSERIYNILDVVGYSQKDRDRKVSCATGWEVFSSMASCFMVRARVNEYLLGSRGEGSTGPELGSDEDYLMALDDSKVVINLSECQSEKENYLMVQDEGVTHSGYAKLQRVKIQSDNAPVPEFLHPKSQYDRVDANGRVVLSNKIVHAFIASGEVISGPALQHTKDNNWMSRDVVFAFRCTQWPNEAHEWLIRRRLHGWPAAHHIQNAEKDGCFAAAVGHPHSCEKDLEWRISFSLTERKLTRTFEDKTMKVYILLKMIKKTYIEPYLDDAFSSYHCKVCMFWMREKNTV